MFRSRRGSPACLEAGVCGFACDLTEARHVYKTLYGCTKLYPEQGLSVNAVGQSKQAETSRFDFWDTRWS